MAPSVVGKALGYLRTEGPASTCRRTVQYVHEHHVREHLPRASASYNGVSVAGARVLDRRVPWISPDKPSYESGTAAALRTHIDSGDHVVVVGGGWGVTVVIAARAVGPDGGVTVFEGAADNVEIVRETAERNDVADRITVNHAVVGSAVDLRGPVGDAPVLAPTDLPDCDVLELDCEGAEMEIIEGLSSPPEIIIVETHGMHGSPTIAVQNVLTPDYEILDQQIADEGERSFCEKNDIKVVTAHRV